MNLRERQALRLIADSSSRDGVTTALLAAHGCDRDTLGILIRAGWVTETVTRAMAGDRAIEALRIKATDAGRTALKGT